MIENPFIMCYNMKVIYLPVAQLDSASDSDSEGRRFKSFRAGQTEQGAAQLCPVLVLLYPIGAEPLQCHRHWIIGTYRYLPSHTVLCADLGS